MILRQLSNFVIRTDVEFLNFDGQWGDIFNQSQIASHKMDL